MSSKLCELEKLLETELNDVKHVRTKGDCIKKLVKDQRRSKAQEQSILSELYKLSNEQSEQNHENDLSQIFSLIKPLQYKLGEVDTGIEDLYKALEEEETAKELLNGARAKLDLKKKHNALEEETAKEFLKGATCKLKHKKKRLKEAICELKPELKRAQELAKEYDDKQEVEREQVAGFNESLVDAVILTNHAFNDLKDLKNNEKLIRSVMEGLEKLAKHEWTGYLPKKYEGKAGDAGFWRWPWNKFRIIFKYEDEEGKKIRVCRIVDHQEDYKHDNFVKNLMKRNFSREAAGGVREVFNKLL